MKIRRIGFVITFIVFYCAVYCGQTQDHDLCTFDPMDSLEGWQAIGNVSVPTISSAQGQSPNPNDQCIQIEFSNKSVHWVGIIRDIPTNDFYGAKGLKLAYKGSEGTYLREIKLEYLDNTQFSKSKNLKADANEWRNDGEILFSDLRCTAPIDACTCYNNYDNNINLKNVKRLVIVATIGKNPGWFAIDNIQIIPEDKPTFWDIILDNVTTVNIIIAGLFSLLGAILATIGNYLKK